MEKGALIVVIFFDFRIQKHWTPCGRFHETYERLFLGLFGDFGTLSAFFEKMKVRIEKNGLFESFPKAV